MSNQTIFRRLMRVKGLMWMGVVFQTLDGIVFGNETRTPAAPHIRDRIEIKRYMVLVIMCLLPSVVSAVWAFGWHALAMIAVSYLCGGIVEVAFAIVRKQEIEEGFLVTGLIFPLVLPPTTPLWIVAVGIVFGIFFGKEVFGGTGRNIFNPALVGRLFITICFPQIISGSWQTPFSDAISSATPLNTYKVTHELTPLADLLFGTTGGSMGEIFRIGILVGGILLLATRVANWRVPVSYLGSVALFSLAGGAISPAAVAPPLQQLLTGGLLFGAFFMATDPITSPLTRGGKYIFGAGLGILTVLIRSLSGYVEGVMFSIVLMNALVPLIDQMVLSFKYRMARP
jgi:RnfABCDGE-type electron transport complex D subunit